MKVQHLIPRIAIVLVAALCFYPNWWVGAGVGGALVAIEFSLRQLPLRRLNLWTLGLLFGYLLGMVVVRALSALDIEGDSRIIYLATLYVGLMVTLRSADKLCFSIPFVRFEGQGRSETGRLLLDASAVADPRLLGVASTGLLDGRLVLPRFVERGLDAEALEKVRKLRELPGLGLRIEERDFDEDEGVDQKLARLARLTGGDVLTAEVGAVGTSRDDVRLINLHTLSKALKPIEASGEYLTLRIQRYGKEEHQGVGYLEDGTMVVVNGGGDYIGQEIESRILSVKHTAAGRMIFCNVAD